MRTAVADLTYVEHLVGRPLRLAEQAIDILGLDTALNTAKDELDRAIRAEQARAIRGALKRVEVVRLQMTKPMLDPLERLFRLGRREAYEELQRAGYPDATRAYVAEPEHPELNPLAEIIQIGLRALSIRLDRERVEAEFSGVAQDAIARALLKVPSARSIAAASVSRALTSGLQVTFEQNQDLVGGWEYTAVLDGGVCEHCAPLDGTTYATLEALYAVLPGFGPNPFCLGGGRCRCRAVPLAA